jgi:dephospho-CoA kinase
MARNKLTREEAELRIASQMLLEAKAQKAIVSSIIQEAGRKRKFSWRLSG